MAKSEFILSIGDDNVVLTKLVDKKVENAWLGSPDPAMAQEELGEALASDPKARIAILIDTLDQSFKEEEMPRVGILDRRKVVARHINMAFPGANLRGARLVNEIGKKSLVYEFASVPLDGRIPGWMDFAQSLPNEKAGVFAIAIENVDIIRHLAPKDIPVDEGRNNWRHLIAVNATGGLRQIIEKNGRLCLTRLTQAPPPETPPDEFAAMIISDFKATITYIRRLGYQVGDPLDLVVLTTAENKVVLQERDWEGARSVSVYTPYEAGVMLGLGALGREDQAFADVLHASWFASKRKSVMPLSKSAAMGDIKDDLRDIGFLIAPYAAGLLAASVIGWAGWTFYNYNAANTEDDVLSAELRQLKSSLDREKAAVAALPYDVARVRNVIEVAETLDVGKIDVVPALAKVAAALNNDASVMSLSFTVGGGQQRPASAGRGAAAAEQSAYTLELTMRLARVITTAQEAVQTARRLNQHLTDSFGAGYKVTMTAEPVGGDNNKDLTGGFGTLSGGTPSQDRPADQFMATYVIEKVGAP
jgi:hypothetical protein